MNITRKLMLEVYKQPPTECMVEMEIDLETLAQRLGNSAWRNKSKKSSAMNGAISVRVRQTIASQAKATP
jgi:hypothetical protein